MTSPLGWHPGALRRPLGLAALAAALACAACTGMSLGENEPGGDTYVDPGDTQPGEHRMGSIAVEPDEDQLWVVHEENRDGDVRGYLAAIDPVAGVSHEVLDLSGTTDRRVVFPADDRMIVLSERGGGDTLTLVDTRRRRTLAEVTTAARYHGTRTAPSGRALVVGDNADPAIPLHVIDTATLERRVLDHGGDTVEAMWNHHDDVLLALSVTDPFGDAPSARLLRYDLTDADLGQPLPAPTVAWQLDGYDWDLWFSYTWIGVSPDDRWAVFPLVKRTAGAADGEHVLLILDQASGGVSLVPGRGPVGFTADGAAIVSYGERPGGGGQDLWLIDPASHATKIVAMPFSGGVSFFPARDAAYVVCTPVGGAGAPVVYDLAADRVRAIETTTLSLHDFVTRPGTGELWLDSAGSVVVLDLASAALDFVPLPGVIASTINVRPTADQAVVGDGETAEIYRIDMASRAVVGDAIALASPFDALDAGALARSVARRLGPSGDGVVQSPFDPAFRPAGRAVRSGLRLAE